MRLIVDGRPYGAAASRRPRRPADADAPVEQQWTVELPPGKHQVIVKAETADSYGLSRPLEVDRSAGRRRRQRRRISDAGQRNSLRVGHRCRSAGRAAPIRPLDAKDAQADRRCARQGRQTAIRSRWSRASLPGQPRRRRPSSSELEQMRSQMTLADTGIIYYAGQDSLDAGGNYVLRATPQGRFRASAISRPANCKSQLAAIPGRLVLMLDLTHAAEHAGRETTAGYLRQQRKTRRRPADGI